MLNPLACRGPVHTWPDAALLHALQPFFEAMHRALKPGGVISTQVTLLTAVTCCDSGGF
jgi:hypothetical protein